MASALRFCASKLIARNSVAGLCKSVPCGRTNVTKIQVAFISSKSLQPLDKNQSAHYPYETKKFTPWDALWDNTITKINEQSKIIVVEGPIAAGKTAVVEALAADFEMKHMPAVTMDMEYINPYGWDMRQLDPQLPPICRSYDVKNYCEDPYHINAAAYQFLMYKHRFSQYVDALAHVLSTGQGVILERCPWSDMIFADAMCNAGYMSKPARNAYYDLLGLTLHKLLLPHLVIYLDIPVPTVKDNIQKRGIPYEVNSKVFSSEYLRFIENIYKQKYLKEISRHSHILIYDWTDEGDVEVVLEDIVRLNFDEQKNEGKFESWNFWDNADASCCRRLYADQKEALMSEFRMPCDLPELNISGPDTKILQDVWENAPGMKYIKGFNADMGDKGLLFKNFPNTRDCRH